MPDRIVPDSRLSAQLRPAASPVDTFSRPAKSPLLDLADSLKEFAPAVGQLGAEIQQRKAQQDAQAGAEDMATAHLAGKSLRQAIADGNINPARSQFYQKAAKKQAAQLAAFDYGKALNNFVVTDLADESDLDAFNKRVAEFTDGWVTQNTDPADKEFAHTFARQAAAIQGNTMEQMSWRVGERKRQQTEENFGRLVSGAVLGEFNWTAPEGRTQRVVGAVNALRQQAFDMGIRGSQVNRLIFDGVTQVAVADGKPEIIDALVDMPTGPDGTAKLLDIPEFREKAAAAYHQAVVEKNRAELAGGEALKQRANTVLAGMQEALLAAQQNGQDPAAVNINAFKHEMNGIDPVRVRELEEARQSFLSGYKRDTVPVIESELTSKVYDPDHRYSLGDLWADFTRGGMSSALYAAWREKIKKRDHVTATRKGPSIQTSLSEGMSIIGQAVDGAVGNVAGVGTMLKGQARTEFRAQAYEWLSSEEGAHATLKQQQEHFRELAQTIAHAKIGSTARRRPPTQTTP